MNVFSYMNGERKLQIGVPTALEWSIESTPCEGGNVLTMYVDGAKDVTLLGGKPVDLSTLTIEVRDFARACKNTMGSAERVSINTLSDKVSFFEVIRCTEKTVHAPIADAPATESNAAQTHYVDRTVFYKWGKVLNYLEDRLGIVLVSSWLDNAMVIEFNNERVVIETTSDFRREIIERRCLKYIQEAFQEIWGLTVTVEVRTYRNG